MAAVRKTKGAAALLLRSWAFYVMLAQVIVGCVLALVSIRLVERFSHWAGLGAGIIIVVCAVLGIAGIAYRLDSLVSLHVVGAILVLSILFPLRFQVVRNTDVDCAIAELSLINTNLVDIADQQVGRSTNVFNMMMMRIKAMSLTIDHLHGNPAENLFNTTSPAEARQEENQHMYYKQVWRVADEHFVSEQLEQIRERARKMMETLRDKVLKRVDKLSKKYDSRQLERSSVDKLEQAVNVALETATTAMRRTHEHLQNRLPEDGLSSVELDELVTALQQSMADLQGMLALIKDEIGEKGNPMGLKRFKKYFGKDGSAIIGGALANADAIKDAMDRQQQDIYNSVKISNVQATRDGYRKIWLDMMISKVNKTALDERTYTKLLPRRCLKSRKQESTISLVGLVLIFLEALKGQIRMVPVSFLS